MTTTIQQAPRRFCLESVSVSGSPHQNNRPVNGRFGSCADDPHPAAATICFIVAYVPRPLSDIDGIPASPVAGLLDVRQTTIISGCCLFPSSNAIACTSTRSGRPASLRWSGLYNGGPYNCDLPLPDRYLLLTMGREWELSYRSHAPLDLCRLQAPL